MPESLFSSSWYRVSALAPRLRSHARIHRQQYRGETWYVLQDSSNERFHRFPPRAHTLIGLMDGERTVQQIWEAAADQLGDDAPTQDETIRLLGQLHASDLLQSDVPPDVLELFDRSSRHDRAQLRSRLVSPFAIRMHLLDPEKLLERMTPYLRPFFGWLGVLLWLAVVVPALVQAGVLWSELSEGVLDRLFTPGNLLVVWLIFPVLKILHEFGHGVAAKHFGGEVHDMGIMLLVFTPVPYVDASSSWAFESRVQRALVGAAGMIVEIFLAAVAFHVWLAAEPGAVRAAAYNVVLIGGATTLLFNANPLLRFDGYYILSDLIEIPNLRARGNAMVGWLTERRLFGNRDAVRPRTARGETGWLVGYTVSAFFYRMLIIVAILSWILDQFFFVGLLLGAFAAVGWIGVPLYKGLRFLLTSPQIRRVRSRAIAVCVGGTATLVLLLAWLPAPLRTQVEGVVWVPDEALVRVASEGFVREVVVEAGGKVEKGDVLVVLEDPELEARRLMLRARVDELSARMSAQRTQDLVAAQLTSEELGYARDSLARTEERVADLVVRAGRAGRFSVVRPRDLPGRFARKGDLLGHVVDPERTRVRAVVSQDDVQLVSRRLVATRVRLAERLSEVREAELLRVVPAASEQLPSSVLGSGGGGEVPVDPRDPQGERAVQKMFEVELEIPTSGSVVHAGGRVHVRFDLGSEPLGVQWGRRLRQIFLSRFQV